jgi:hypothetical protein
MNRIAGWLTTLRTRREKRPPDTDLADMGTTFGLDAALPGMSEASRAGLPSRPRDEHQLPQDRPTRPARL